MTPKPAHNPDLPLPPATAGSERLAAPDTLAQASAALDAVRELSGRRTQIVLNLRHGIQAFSADGMAGTGAWHWVDAVGATVVRAPRMVRRELASPIGTLLETVVVPDGLPGLIVQIERIAGPADAGPLRLRIQLPAAGTEAFWSFNQQDGAIVLSDGARRLSLGVSGASGAAGVSADGAALSWEVGQENTLISTDGASEGGPGSNVRGDNTTTLVLSLDLTVGEPVTILVMLDAEGERGASLPALAALPAHHRRAELDADGEGHAGLRVSTGVAEIDDGIRWIRARLRDRLRRPPGGEGDLLHPTATNDTALSDTGSADSASAAAATHLLVRGALATGDWEVARAALVTLSPSPGMLMAWARWVGWTGQGALMLSHREIIETALAELTGTPPFTADRVRKAVADAAEAAGAEDWAEALRAATDGESAPPVDAANAPASALPASAPSAPATPAPTPPATDRPGRMTLPVVGGPQSGTASDPTADAEGHPSTPTPPTGPTHPSKAAVTPAASTGAPSPTQADLFLAAELALPLPIGLPSGTDNPGAIVGLTDAADDPGAAAIASLRAWSLGMGDEAYPGFRQALGIWGERAPADESSAGAVATALVEGMLGARPDAAFGRLRLAPTFPSSWTGIQVDGITVEKMRLGMTYVRDGDRHSFVFTPEAGSVPGMLIFEPRLPGESLREVRIDGQVAEVGSEKVGDRVQIQVQLPADAERRIEIDLQPLTPR